MAEVLVIRHGPKDKRTKQLTPEGREETVDLGRQFGPFDVTLSGSLPRMTETATLVSGKKPAIDERLQLPFQVTEEDKERGREHPYGTLGVLLENSGCQELLVISGLQLIAAMRETRQALAERQIALLVTGEINTFMAKRILRNEVPQEAIENIDYLHGFQEKDDMSIQDFPPLELARTSSLIEQW